jgi:hypothetical protein
MEKNKKETRSNDFIFPTTGKQKQGSRPSPPKFRRGDRIRINDFDFKVLKVKENRVVLKPIGFELEV